MVRIVLPRQVFVSIAACVLSALPSMADTPAERMAARYPQPVRTGDLVGLPVQDGLDRIYGYVSEVVRTPDGQTRLVVPYSTWLGWWPDAPFVTKRPVAVPIETVAILGRHINALDFHRADFEDAPAWSASDGAAIPADETIRIALGKR